jgi:glycosyltransferase involved in cell wall biosynthesis
MVMDEKKVLQLRSSIGFYGAEAVISELCKGLISSKYKPVIGVIKNQKNPHTELHNYSKSNNIESEIFECRGLFDLNTILCIRQFIKANKIDIVHTHGYKSNFYAFCATLLKNIPLVATCHPWIISNRRGKFYSAIDKILLRKFDSVVSISDQVKHKLLKAGIPGHKISIIENGINVQSFKNMYNVELVRDEYDIPLKGRVICSVGRLSLEKGHHYFLEAAKKVIDRFPDTYFILAGEGFLLNNLQKHTKIIKIDRKVSFLGFVKDIPKLLSAIDIFVLPSLTEGIPMALLEAMAAKKPVVSTNVGSVPNLIIPDKTGLLVKPGDPVGLTNAIEELLVNNCKAQNLAENGYKMVLTRYTSAQMTRKYLDIYNAFSNSSQH